jgi:hypothetical protein
MVSDESHFKVLWSQTKTHYTEIHPHSCAILNRGWWQDQKVLEASICVRVSQRVKFSCSTIGFMQHIRKWTLFTHQASCAQKIPSSHLCLQISAGKEHTINIVHDSNSKGLDKCSDIWCEVGHGHSVEKMLDISPYANVRVAHVVFYKPPLHNRHKKCMHSSTVPTKLFLWAMSRPRFTKHWDHAFLVQVNPVYVQDISNPASTGAWNWSMCSSTPMAQHCPTYFQKHVLLVLKQ